MDHRTCLLLVALAAALPARAQQYGSDDAFALTRGHVRAEVWGHTDGTLWGSLYATPRAWLEVGGGVGRLPDGAAEGFVQAKVVLRAADEDRLGVGLVVGVGADRQAAVADVAMQGPYAYVPLGVSLAGARVSAYGYGGWACDLRDRSHGALAALGIEGVAVPERLSVVFDLVGASGEAADVQAGLRLYLRPDRWIDVSAGTPGPAVGVSWTF